MTALLKPRYKDLWWPEGAFVHVSKEHPEEHVRNKCHEVCNGKLIRCPFTECLEPGVDDRREKACNGLAISLRVHDPNRSIVLARRWKSDGKSIYEVPSWPATDSQERYKAGDEVVVEWSDGWIYPKAVCLSYVSRGRKKGYRWCGHKSSDIPCRCRHGFTHLKDGEW